MPLFGVLAADYFVLRRRRYQVDELYRPQGRYWYRQGVNLWAVAAWALGVAAYQLIARSLPWLGATIPSFVIAFVLQWLLANFRFQIADFRLRV